jgi:hypothetical protein
MIVRLYYDNGALEEVPVKRYTEMPTESNIQEAVSSVLIHDRSDQVLMLTISDVKKILNFQTVHIGSYSFYLTKI